MRHTSLQLPLTASWIAYAHAVELAAMSKVLEMPDLQYGLDRRNIIG